MKTYCLDYKLWLKIQLLCILWKTGLLVFYSENE